MIGLDDAKTELVVAKVKFDSAPDYAKNQAKKALQMAVRRVRNARDGVNRAKNLVKA